ncbi:TPM domain-containing protein [Nocardia sp. NPDC050175]|uniref:TPM domain-containing protein n=1 Tax=Nocardia sp. NPDC050175 TaxID=3364317 RepID=UPI00379A4CB5
MSLPNRVARWTSWVVLSVLFAGAALVGAPTGTAEAPLRMDTYVVDSAQALNGGQLDQVRSAVDQLYADQQVRLWVVYVRDFGGLGPEVWAQRTASQSGFGDRDLLLAVATQDRSYWFYGELPSGVSDSKLNSLLTRDVEPALRDGRWADAGVATADGLKSAMRGGGVNVGFLLVIGVLVVLVVGGFVLFARKRRRDRAKAELAVARGGPGQHRRAGRTSAGGAARALAGGACRDRQCDPHQRRGIGAGDRRVRHDRRAALQHGARSCENGCLQSLLDQAATR